jgi:acetylornithine/N-succinyldiaminopimelate aminotransferase
MLEGFAFVPFNDIDALENAIDEQTCAVMLEPIQGEGGICCPDSAIFSKRFARFATGAGY